MGWSFILLLNVSLVILNYTVTISHWWSIVNNMEFKPTHDLTFRGIDEDISS